MGQVNTARKQVNIIKMLVNSYLTHVNIRCLYLQYGFVVH